MNGASLKMMSFEYLQGSGELIKASGRIQIIEVLVGYRVYSPQGLKTDQQGLFYIYINNSLSYFSLFFKILRFLRDSSFISLIYGVYENSVRRILFRKILSQKILSYSIDA